MPFRHRGNSGCENRIRTDDPKVMSLVLCLLSYLAIVWYPVRESNSSVWDEGPTISPEIQQDMVLHDGIEPPTKRYKGLVIPLN